MAYAAGNLHMAPAAPGDIVYKFDAVADTMLTVAASGYFNNTTSDLNLVVDDLIICDCTDGRIWLKVASISSGAVTCQLVGGDLPVNTFATGTAAELSAAVVPGYLEAGTSVSSASRVVLPTPYAGAVFHVQKIDSGTAVIEFDAGGSGGTGVTFDGSNRRISLRAEGEGFRVKGTSATRWRIEYLNHHASAVSEGASVVLTST